MCRGEQMFQDVRSFMALSWKDGMTFADHGEFVSRSLRSRGGSWSFFLKRHEAKPQFTQSTRERGGTPYILRTLTVAARSPANDVANRASTKTAPCNTQAEGFEFHTPAAGYFCPVCCPSRDASPTRHRHTLARPFRLSISRAHACVCARVLTCLLVPL